MNFVTRNTRIYISDCANYIIKRIDVNHMKLQKLLYYSYAAYLVKYKESLAVNLVEAWQKGPVFKRLYQKLKHYDKDEIIKDPVSQTFESKLNWERKQVMYFIISKYGWVDSGSLMRQSMREAPFDNYFEETPMYHFPKACYIPDEAIYHYFKDSSNWYVFPKYCPTCLQRM
ncbi:Panacea domain-containing protein [Chrysanthemum yellows phytoplasma]|uniref:Panacea domain-containing protein n=1 Tax=Chrysanthemum yellows phytoplasma TaxID=238674 RepID=UPI00068E2C77|nr:type II toxin-antitoxin system antitoxin SocA domain-containing protein [Chrysanthemum yellows phytoplasma]